MAKDYLTLSKEELLKLIEKQEAELKSKKYGLVWDAEREPEQVVLDCENNLPVLKRVKGKEIRTNDEDDNILIEGDNYHALTVLNYTHKGKIDVIYIDPPYNTGKANEWKYNDKYVDENDGYRHSKWLNFMEKRLKLAKNLLKKNGVIFISIDNHESSQLKMLCDKIFKEDNFIAEITREAIKGGSQSKHIRESHDYVLVYAMNKDSLEFSGYEKEGIVLNLKDARGMYAKGRELNKWGVGSRREDSPSMWYAIPGPDGNDVFPIRNDGSEGRWRLGRKKMFQKISTGDVIFEERKDGTYIVYEKIRDNSSKTKQFTTLFKDEYINAKGGEILKKIFGTSMSIFDYAKPVELIIDLLVMANVDKNSVILDFFAGSGTTGQAVLELNKKDNGNRKFILCTNNEVGNENEINFCKKYNILRGELKNWKNKKEWVEWFEKYGICSAITYPRIYKVINGYEFRGKDKEVLLEKKLTFSQFKNINKILEDVNRIIEKNKIKYNKIEKKFENNTIKIIGIKNIDGIKDGIGGNLQYLKTNLIKKAKNKDQVRIDLTQKCTEMLCVKENIFNIEKEIEDYKIFVSNKKDKFLCVYYNFLEDSFDDFLEELQRLKGKKIIYMFSMDGKVDKGLFSEIDDFEIEEIPQKIIDIYKQLVKMNIPVNADFIFSDFEKAKERIFTNKEKDEGARILRIVIEKVIQKIAQNNGLNILKNNTKEEKIAILNDKLKVEKLFSKVEWEENKTYIAIGNHAAHGEYSEYDLKNVENFYKHIQKLIDRHNIQ